VGPPREPLSGPGQPREARAIPSRAAHPSGDGCGSAIDRAILRRAGGLWTASATQSARRPWAHRDMDRISVRPYTSAATRPMRATLTRAPCSTAASIRAMSRSRGLRRTLLRAPQAPTAVTHPATCVSRPGIHRSTCREDASASGPHGLRRWPRRGSRNRRPARLCRG